MAGRDGSRRWLVVAIALAAVAAIVAQAGPARAACGGIVSAQPTERVNPKGRAPVAIGDSVMILAVKKLAREGYHANAKGCRQWYEGVQTLQRKREHHRLPHLATLALGSNGPVTTALAEQAVKAMPKNRVLAFVTPRGSVAGGGADAMRTVAKRHRHRVVLLDWVRYSAGHGDWFGSDRLHLTYSGAAAYARLMGKAIRFAKPGSFPNGARFPR
jgi:hypothetical protein